MSDAAALFRKAADELDPADTLRKAREAADMTQAECAKKVETSRSRWASWEAEGPPRPGYKNREGFHEIADELESK